MSRLPLRLLAVAFSLAGLMALADLEQQSLRRSADRVLAPAVAGYLALVVPTTSRGALATDQLLSRVHRLGGSDFWHAGLQVLLAGAPVLDVVTPPDGAAWAPVVTATDGDTLGMVAVWSTLPRGVVPGISWVLAVAACLVAGLATTRRVGWLWPVLGLVLAGASVHTLLSETARVADRAATTTLAHIGPMAALALLDARLPVAALTRMGEALHVREVGTAAVPSPPGWAGEGVERRAVVQFVRGSGVIVEVALAPPRMGSRALHYGLAGGALILLLAVFPPIRPGRRPRLPSREDGATIPR